ncbi:MAG: CHAT domain-containing tetratricopeptide repeat protein [Bacteroidota bacterium]|nr:CHAT domain-containing tetratricopeptide repeat protein [Bacteroidota bacterium]
MKNKIFFTIMIVAQATIFHNLNAQNLKAEYDSARYHIQRNNCVAALPWLNKAKTTAAANPKDTNSYVEVIKLMAVCYAKTNDTSKAESYFKETCDLYAKMPTKKPQYASALQNYGVYYYNKRKFAKAEPVFVQAENIQKAVSGEKKPEYVSILNSLATTYLSLKKYPEAEASYKKLSTLRKELLGVRHPDYIVALNGLVNVFKATGKIAESIPVCKEIVEITLSEKGTSSREYATALTQLGNSYKLLMQYEKADPCFFDATNAYQTSVGERNNEYIVSLVNLASIYKLEGKMELAEPIYLKAMNLMKETAGENSVEYASVLNNIALYYTENGRYELAEAYFRLAIDISKKVIGDRHPDIAVTYNNLGLLYKNMGRYDQAEPMLKKSQKIRKDILGEKHPDYAESLNNLAGLYEVIGRYDQAEILYKQAMELTKSQFGERSLKYAYAVNNLAGVYEELKKYTQAEQLYTLSLSLVKEFLGENHPDFATTLNNMALLKQAMGKKEDALALFKRNLETTRASLGDKHPNFLTSMSNYAALLENMNKNSEAETYFINVLNARKETLGEKHPSYTNTLYELAKLYSCMKNYSQADIYWDKALGNYLYEIDTYFPGMSEKEKGKFYNTVSPRFEQFNSYCLIRYKDNPAILSKMYDYEIATKALLLNSTNKVRQRILNSGDNALIEKFKTWNSQKELLARAYTMSKEELTELKINLDELNNTTNDLEKELSASSEVFSNANESKVTWLDIQKKLKPEEAAVEVIRFTKFKFDSAGIYISDSVHYAALIINTGTKSNPEIATLKNGVDLEKAVIKYYRNSIKFKNEDEISYSQYWTRIKTKIPSNIKTIYFSPDGVYNQLNMNTLRNVQTKTFLMDEIDLKVVTNTKDIVALGRPDNSTKQITLIGSPDFSYTTRNAGTLYPGIPAEHASFIERTGSQMLNPLPGTKVEIEKISGMLGSSGWKTETLTEQNALEENVKKVNNPKVLHIATHGFFEQDAQVKKKKKADDNENSEIENPLMRSGLYLAGSSLTLLKRKNEQTNIDISQKNKEDGVLTAYEAMNLNLDKTDLVVLSACETGLGDVRNGEGVYGLQRAFNVAGTKSLIFSLWTVNDASTQKLMTNFYQEWIKTGNKRQAFKTAQLNLRKENPEPYYWGAFVMIGE